MIDECFPQADRVDNTGMYDMGQTDSGDEERQITNTGQDEDSGETTASTQPEADELKLDKEETLPEESHETVAPQSATVADAGPSTAA